KKMPCLIGKYLRTSSTRTSTSLLIAVPLRALARGVEAGGLAADPLGLRAEAERAARQPAGPPVRQRAPFLRRAGLGEVGWVGTAAVHDVLAPRVEGAAGRQVDQAGRGSGDGLEPALVAGRARHRLQEPLGVGVVRPVVQVAAAGPFDRL